MTLDIRSIIRRDRPVRGFVVNCSTGQLGRLTSSDGVTVEYPAVANGTPYMVRGDVWFNTRPAMLSDAHLYDAELWNEAALTAAVNTAAASA